MANPLFNKNPNITWEIWLNYPEGTRRKALDFAVEWDCTQIINDLGSFSVTLPMRQMDKLGLLEPELDSIIEMRRAAWGSPLTEVFGGFIRAYDYGIDEMELGGYGWNYLLDSRVVAYYAGSSYASKSAEIDDMLKALARENLGSLATDTTRDLSANGLSIDADLAEGAVQTRAFANKELLDVMRELSFAAVEGGEPVYFGIEHPTLTTWQFKTYLGQPGQDLTTSIQPFSLEAGTLANPHYLIDRRKEVNRYRVGGQNEGAERTYVTVNDTARQAASPWNLRERFLDRRNLEDAQLEGAGQAALQAAQPVKKFTADLLDVQGSRFNLDWHFGDRVPVRFRGLTFTGLVKATTLTVAPDGAETIQARVEAEL